MVTNGVKPGFSIFTVYRPSARLTVFNGGLTPRLIPPIVTVPHGLTVRSTFPGSGLFASSERGFVGSANFSGLLGFTSSQAEVSLTGELTAAWSITCCKEGLGSVTLATLLETDPSGTGEVETDGNASAITGEAMGAGAAGGGNSGRGAVAIAGVDTGVFVLPRI